MLEMNHHEDRGLLVGELSHRFSQPGRQLCRGRVLERFDGRHAIAFAQIRGWSTAAQPIKRPQRRQSHEQPGPTLHRSCPMHLERFGEHVLGRVLRILDGTQDAKGHSKDALGVTRDNPIPVRRFTFSHARYVPASMSWASKEWSQQSSGDDPESQMRLGPNNRPGQGLRPDAASRSGGGRVPRHG